VGEGAGAASGGGLVKQSQSEEKEFKKVGCDPLTRHSANI